MYDDKIMRSILKLHTKMSLSGKIYSLIGGLDHIVTYTPFKDDELL